MESKTKQHNKKGDNIGKDYIGGDKINALIGKIIGSNNITNIHVPRLNKFKLPEEEEKKFSKFIPDDKVSDFRNLIERIEFSYDLYDLDNALEFIEEANKIYHNHPILLVLSGLCEYSVLDKIEVIKHPKLLLKPIKLFEKAREVHPEYGTYRGWSLGVANHFYEILEKNIDEIKKQIHWYFSTKQYIEYYKAIAKHLIHFENCFKISEDVVFLKNYVNHLAGYEGYAWFNISNDGSTIDLGDSIFEGGAMRMLDYLEKEIRAFEKDYNLPEIQYGAYFENPEKKDNVLRSKKRLQIITAIFLAGALLILSLFMIFSPISWDMKLMLFGYPIVIWLLSHQFGSRLSVFQMISKSIYNIIK